MACSIDVLAMSAQTHVFFKKLQTRPDSKARLNMSIARGHVKLALPLSTSAESSSGAMYAGVPGEGCQGKGYL